VVGKSVLTEGAGEILSHVNLCLSQVRDELWRVGVKTCYMAAAERGLESGRAWKPCSLHNPWLRSFIS